VTGVVIGMLQGAGAIDPPTAGWSIWQGVAAGKPGTLVAAGVGSASLLPTGATFLGIYTVYNVTVKVKPSVKLNPGTYFVNVIPNARIQPIPCVPTLRIRTTWRTRRPRISSDPRV
jgi:hypothetical protein